MRKQIKKLLHLGIHDGLSKNEQKLVQLLNFICLAWYTIILFFGITDYFLEDKYLVILCGHLFQFSVLTIVQFLQYKRKYIAARVLFVSVSFVQFFIFSNVLLTGNLIEFFYLLIPLFSLLFLKDKRFHYFYLLLAIVSFVFPKYYFSYYDTAIFSDPTTMPILFIAIFLLVNYFKNLNLKNENLLENQRNEALKDKELIQKQKQELEELHQFQNQFFVNVSHEIRTPLTIVKGNAHQLKKKCKENGLEILEAIFAIEKQSSKIQQIVDDVMDLTKMDSNDFHLKMEDVMFSAFLSNIYYSFHSNFQHKGIEYTFKDSTTKNIILKADALYLERAINNFVFNALKYTDAGGEVELVLEEVDNHVLLSIKDSGIGITENDLEKVFNRFYQVDNTVNRAGGSGIGLAFSKEIIAKHKGEITVDSTVGEGTVFKIILPIYKHSDLVHELEERELSHSFKHTSKLLGEAEQSVLLVDDHDEMRNYLKSILKEYHIIEARDGIEALDVLKTNSVDFIVSDYMMPKMDGYEFVKILKRKGITIPVLMLTARTDFEAKMNTLRLGIDDYITKPFNEEEILVRIKNGLNNNQQRSEYLKDEKLIVDDIQEEPFLNELQSYIEKNCVSQYFGLPDICENFALSTSSLYRRIKALSGLSPKEFVTEVRLQKARKILEENKSISLKELAITVGFVNYTHFGNLYKNRFGITL